MAVITQDVENTKPYLIIRHVTATAVSFSIKAKGEDDNQYILINSGAAPPNNTAYYFCFKLDRDITVKYDDTTDFQLYLSWFPVISSWYL